MKFFTDRKFNKMMGRLNELEEKVKVDTLVDPFTTRGGADDRTQRLVGKSVSISNINALSKYIANGFVQNIIDSPADDSVREWIKITTNLDGESGFDYVKAIENRLDDLNVKDKIHDLVKYSRLFSKGSFLYYAVKSNQVQSEEILKDEIPKDITTIEFIHVIDDPDRVTLTNLNSYSPIKKDYNKIKFSMNATEIHPSRLSWLVNSFIPSEMRGISVVQTINDAIVAQDNGLWSSATVLNSIALNIFKSDEIADLNPIQKAELLAKIKHLMITFSAIALKTDEDFQQLSLNMTGMKEIFDFIFDNLSGLAKIPKNILLGKAHGVVTAGEYDTLNYYSNIAKFQENRLRKIIKKIIDLVIREQNGEIYKALGGQDLEVDFEFNSLWKLDPVANAEKELKESQRDQIDITLGKINPAEARSLDDRYMHLEPFKMSGRQPLDLEAPDLETDE